MADVPQMRGRWESRPIGLGLKDGLKGGEATGDAGKGETAGDAFCDAAGPKADAGDDAGEETDGIAPATGEGGELRGGVWVESAGAAATAVLLPASDVCVASTTGGIAEWNKAGLGSAEGGGYGLGAAVSVASDKGEGCEGDAVPLVVGASCPCWAETAPEASGDWPETIGCRSGAAEERPEAMGDSPGAGEGRPGANGDRPGATGDDPGEI